MLWRWIFAAGVVVLACSRGAGAQPSAREARVVEVHNSFSGPSGGIRIVDAGSGPAGTFRLGLNTEFFLGRDVFVETDRVQHFAGNLSLSITPTEYLEVFISAAATSAWSDSNDPLLIQRVPDVLLGLKGFYRSAGVVTVGGDGSVAFLGGVGDASATFRATSFGLRVNLAADLRKRERKELPLIARLTAQYWFDNSAKLTEGIEDRRYSRFGGQLPRALETRHLLTAFERFAFGVNRVDTVRLAAGLDFPLPARNVGLRPMLEWDWRFPVNRQGFRCVRAKGSGDGCLADEGLEAFPMTLTLGLRILPPPKGLAFTVAADVGLTGSRVFTRELAPTAPYNVILGIGYAFDTKRPQTRPVPVEAAPVPPPTVQIRGRVRERQNDQPVEGAVVAVVGQDASPQVTDAEGRFVTYALPEGEAVLEVSHPEFHTAQCAAPVSTEADCLLVPLRREGQLRLLAVDADGSPVPKVEITVRGPSEHRVISSETGVATVDALDPGPYTAHVDDPVFFIALAELEIFPRQETTVRLRVIRKPSRPTVVLKKRQIALRRQVSFATGSDEILPNSEPILMEVADVLLRNPDIELIEIQGHTDNRGERAVNMRLSQQRAEAVQRWLVSHGVEPARLIAKGYGPTRPIVPNITQGNRARNRRVQFKIVRRVDLTAAAPK